jgi:hypothetical protein
MGEKDNAIMIGSALDELVRHHPSLKDQVFEGIQAMLQSIEDQGKAWVPPTAEESSYRLIHPTVAKESAAGDTLDVPMEPVASPDGATTPVPAVDNPEETPKKADSPAESIILSFIDVAVKVDRSFARNSYGLLTVDFSFLKAYSNTHLTAVILSSNMMGSNAWAGFLRYHAFRFDSTSLIRPSP